MGDTVSVAQRNITVTINGASQTVSNRYFDVTSISASGVSGYYENGNFVITSIDPTTSTSTLYVNVYLELKSYYDIDVVHEFYVNDTLTNTIEETATNVTRCAANYSSATPFKIRQKTSGTLTAGGRTYDISAFTVNDALITATGLTVARATTISDTNKFAVPTFDYSTDTRQVVIRYDLTEGGE